MSQVKTSIKRSTRVYRKWVKRGRNPDNYKNVRKVQNISSKLINQAKQLYYHNLGDKLSDLKIGQKSFWTAFKRIVNTKKQTNIPPIIENDVYISDFSQKANIFNEYFATQCTINDNGSTQYIPYTNKSISIIFNNMHTYK